MNARGLLTFIVFVPATMFFGLAGTIGAFLGWGNATMFFGKGWSWCLLRAVGARWRIHDADRLVRDRPTIFLANHQSNVDVWLMLWMLPLSTKFVAKHSLFRVPFLGWAMKASGFISVDRTDRQRAIRSLRAAAERIRSGASVVLYPEGTRSADGRLQPFKKGPFHLAHQAGVTIQPLVIEGTSAILPRATLRARAGRADVRVLPAIEPADYAGDGTDDLRKRLERVFREALPEKGPAESSDGQHDQASDSAAAR